MIFDSDTYNILDLISDIRAKYIDESSTTLNASIYGYLGEVLANITQNSVIAATEWGNEAFPIRAKLERTNLSNAITYGIDDLNAVPATMKVWIGFIESELISAMASQNNIKNTDLIDNIFGTFRLYQDCPIYIEDYEYHLDYDMLISRAKIDRTGSIAYTARYDIARNNALSSITNPYLPSPIYLKVDNNNFIFISCTIRQVSYEVIEKKMLSNNIIDNKTIDFEFENQLANFTVKVTEGSTDYYLTAIPEGMPLNGEELYCYYSYIDSTRIRIKFDRASYVPRTSCTVYITIATTEGADGNFEYRTDIMQNLNSDKYDYMNLSTLIKPRDGSTGGRDRKTIEELREIIPKEILSRGSISTDADLNNYFNSLENSRLHFYKRKQNQCQFWYYAYLLIKDSYSNISPTNTIDIKLALTGLNSVDDRYLLPAGSIIKYDGTAGVIDNSLSLDQIKDLEYTGFVYTNPISMVINKDPLSISYYLDIVNTDTDINFDYINDNSTLQFIADGISLQRLNFNSTSYKVYTAIQQNITTEFNLVTYEEGNITGCKIKPIIVLTDGDSNYYCEGTVLEYDSKTYSYELEFSLKSDNTINKNNKIKFTNLNSSGTSGHIADVLLSQSVKASIYVYVDLGEDLGRGSADTIVPDMAGYTLCNIYSSTDNITFFYNYSEVITSKVTATVSDIDQFNIYSVPVAKYTYVNNPDRRQEFIDYVQYRKAFIDGALEIIEDFGIDFRFYNTYGPSKVFTIGHEGKALDRVNLKMKFAVKLLDSSDKSIITDIISAIKDYMENLNNITSIHISNLIAFLTDTFSEDIAFIEFKGINNEDSTYQYLERHALSELEGVPEFLNITNNANFEPDIEITIV